MSLLEKERNGGCVNAREVGFLEPIVRLGSFKLRLFCLVPLPRVRLKPDVAQPLLEVTAVHDDPGRAQILQQVLRGMEELR